MASPAPRPVWGADCPVSMPVAPPQSETKVVGMHGFSFTQYRLVHDITASEYESLRVPVYAPVNPAAQVADDAGIDAHSSLIGPARIPLSRTPGRAWQARLT